MFALELLSSFSSLGMRGPMAWLELAVHGAVAVTCAVAGRMLRTGAPGAPRLAVVGVVSRAVVSIQALLWTRLPSNVAPGSRGFLIALAVATAIVWVSVLRWSSGQRSSA